MPNGFTLKNMFGRFCLNIILITSMFEGGYSFHVDINYIVCLRTNQAGKKHVGHLQVIWPWNKTAQGYLGNPSNPQKHKTIRNNP